MLRGIMEELAHWARQQWDSEVKVAELEQAARGELSVQRREELARVSAKYGIRASLVDVRRIAEVEAAVGYCGACPGYDACRYGGLKPAMEIKGGAAYYVIECDERRRRVEGAVRQRAYEEASLPEYAVADVVEYAGTLYDEVRGVYVSGGYKTSILTHIGRQRIKGGHHTLYVSVPEVMGRLLPSVEGSGELMKRLKGVDSLLLDDIGVGRAGEWVVEQMYIIIDARLRSQLWTSGAGERLDEVRRVYGERVVRRLSQLTKIVEG